MDGVVKLRLCLICLLAGTLALPLLVGAGGADDGLRLPEDYRQLERQVATLRDLLIELNQVVAHHETDIQQGRELIFEGLALGQELEARLSTEATRLYPEETEVLAADRETGETQVRVVYPEPLIPGCVYSIEHETVPESNNWDAKYIRYRMGSEAFYWTFSNEKKAQAAADPARWRVTPVYWFVESRRNEDTYQNASEALEGVE